MSALAGYCLPERRDLPEGLAAEEERDSRPAACSSARCACDAENDDDIRDRCVWKEARAADTEGACWLNRRPEEGSEAAMAERGRVAREDTVLGVMVATDRGARDDDEEAE
jgi:hypothetical protein